MVDCVDHTLAAIDCLSEPDACLISGACSQRELWGEVEQMLLDYLFEIKIDDLAKEAARVGRRSRAESGDRHCELIQVHGTRHLDSRQRPRRGWLRSENIVRQNHWDRITHICS